MPALGRNCKSPGLIWSKQPGAPLGETAIVNGRYQVKLFELEAAADAPDESVFVMFVSLPFLETCFGFMGTPNYLRLLSKLMVNYCYWSINHYCAAFEIKYE